jgi:hypothetical protein
LEVVIAREIATGSAWTVAQLGASPIKFEFRKTPRARRSNSIVAIVANANATGTGTYPAGRRFDQAPRNRLHRLRPSRYISRTLRRHDRDEDLSRIGRRIGKIGLDAWPGTS